MLPAVKVVGLLSNSSDPTAKRQIDELEAAARPLGITLHLAFAKTESEIDDALAMLAQRQIEAFTINGSPFFLIRMNQIIGLTARYRMPDMYGGREYAAAGGLMAYGASITEAYRQEGVYAGKILKGEKPGDLPVMQSAKFELFINLKTARRLGLTPSSGLLSIADEVIE
jgi:putative ABC transport system substrate-binding protein